MSSYAFGDSGAAAARLEVVHRVFAPLAERVLDDAVPEPPSSIVDLGSGPGYTTALLATRWPSARVTALERSPAFAAATRARVPRATVVEGDVTDAKALPTGHADLVYARCLLAHLPDVAAAIRTWRGWLAPGGLLVMEEPELIHTADRVFRRYLAATAATVQARGATMLAGPLVHAAVAGLDGVVIDRLVRHAVAIADAATMFHLNLATIRDDPSSGLAPDELGDLDIQLAARRRWSGNASIEWDVRQVVVTRR